MSTKQKPSALLLVFLHNVLLIIYMLYGVGSGPYAVLAFLALLILLCISGVYHLVLWLSTRKRLVRNIIRIPAYFVPVTLFILLNAVLSTGLNTPNQMSPLSSPSKNYTMKMKIENNRWKVSIFDKTGKQMYRDNHSRFVGHLNVYWVWDKADRLWLYNSDDSWIYYWVHTPSGWRKVCWTQQKDQKKPINYAPPTTLFPDYAKKAAQ